MAAHPTPPLADAVPAAMPATEPTLAEVRALAIERGLADRSYQPLLIPDRALRAEIPWAPTEKAQLTADLLTLAALRDADDRPIRLAAWLREAAKEVAPHLESAQFEAWAAFADRPHAFATPSWRPRRRWWGAALVAAALVAAIVAAVAVFKRPLTWPGPEPVVVELPSGPLRVDRDEVSRADLGDCHLAEPPAGQAAWCAALGEIIDSDAIISASVPGTGRRSVVGVPLAVAEQICALRSMRLPRDDEFTGLLALGQPAWPALDGAVMPVAALAGHDERGPQQIMRLATGAAEFVRVDGGYRVRGMPALSEAASRLIARVPSKAMHEVAAPPLGEGVAGPDTGFRCVGDVE